jgi:hypothetical protein
MANQIADGSYMARGVSMELIKGGPPKETPGVTVSFAILDEGPYKGRIIEWTGWLSEMTKERTAESLAICGFDGQDKKTISKDLVQIVVEEETYVKDQGTPNEKTYRNAKVKWVNDPSRGRTQFVPMDQPAQQAAMQGLRGLVLAQRALVLDARAKAAAGAPAAAGSGSSFAFGANAAPPTETQAPATAGKKMF